MTEGAEGQKPRIVVNAHGEEREVEPVQEKKPGVVREILKDAAIAGAGALAVEGMEHLGKAVGGAVAKKLTEAVGGQKGGSAGAPPGGPPETPSGAGEGKERPGQRSFNEIQEDLKALIGKPDPERETQLRMERARLLAEAKEVGVFGTIKHHLEDIQSATPDFIKAGEKIGSINIDNLEVEARGLRGWSDKFEGMLDEYRDVAILNMEHALLEAEGTANPKHMAELEREIEVRSWGTVPPGLEALAREYLLRSSTTGSGGDVVNELRKLREDIRGETPLELPADSEEQRAFIRILLESVEKSNKDCNDPVNSLSVRRLEVALERMLPDIAEEVVARLAIHDSSELVKQAAGYIEARKDGGINITAALGESQRRGHDLSQRVVEIFYKEGFQELNLPKAWDVLEDANYHYRDMINEINTLIIKEVSDGAQLSAMDRGRLATILNSVNYDSTQLNMAAHAADKAWLIGKIGQDNINRFVSTYATTVTDEERASGRVPVRHYTDSNVSRAMAVREYIIAKLAGETDARTNRRVGTHNARTAYHIAMNMARATLETSVWNQSALSGNDELGEVIGLREYRLRRREPGRSRGPMIHEEAIPGFGNSWIRLKRSGDIPDDTTAPLYSSDVDVAKVDNGSNSYSAYGPGILNRYKALENLLLNREPPPGEITVNSLQEAVPYFNTSDPMSKEDQALGYNTGKLMLRVWWLAGVVDIALAYPSLGWNREAFDELRSVACRKTLSSEAGSFVTEAQWRWIESVTRFGERVRKLGIGNYVKSLGSSGGGGGGKGKKK